MKLIQLLEYRRLESLRQRKCIERYLKKGLDFGQADRKCQKKAGKGN